MTFKLIGAVGDAAPPGISNRVLIPSGCCGRHVSAPSATEELPVHLTEAKISKASVASSGALDNKCGHFGNAAGLSSVIVI